MADIQNNLTDTMRENKHSAINHLLHFLNLSTYMAVVAAQHIYKQNPICSKNSNGEWDIPWTQPREVMHSFWIWLILRIKPSYMRSTQHQPGDVWIDTHISLCCLSYNNRLNSIKINSWKKANPLSHNKYYIADIVCIQPTKIETL